MTDLLRTCHGYRGPPGQQQCGLDRLEIQPGIPRKSRIRISARVSRQRAKDSTKRNAYSTGQFPICRLRCLESVSVAALHMIFPAGRPVHLRSHAAQATRRTARKDCHARAPIVSAKLRILADVSSRAVLALAHAPKLWCQVQQDFVLRPALNGQHLGVGRQVQRIGFPNSDREFPANESS